MKPGHRFLKLNIAVAAVLAFLFIVGAACERIGGDSATETPTPVAAAPTPSPTALPTESPTPTPTALPTATPTPAPLSGAEIFSRVSPNIPVVITGSGLGSGVLIPGGFIVTNAHVVWGYPNVLVKFPNSNTHRTLPVVGLDLMADLAVIGPVNVLPEGLELEDGEDLAIGSDVYLVGYPDEVDVFPDKPTISRGVISRFRQWRTLDLTLIQSDAATGGGQSGGVMVSEHGEVIGITTKMFGDGSFIIATSAADIRERVDGLIQGRDVDGLRDRRLPSRGATEHEFKLTDRWHSKIAVLYEREDTEIEIRLEGEADSAFAVADISGELILDVDDSESGVEWGSTTLETLGPHFVLFEQFSSDPGEFALESSHDLHFIDDTDDHRRVSVNQSIIGNVDAPFDEDYFELQLDAGESVTIRVESFMIDPYVRVARADRSRVADSDDDGGGGVLGRDAFVSFTAPESGTYIILVSDSWNREVGGYFLKIDGAPRRAVSPPPTATPVPRPVASPHGLMATYDNAEFDFSIQYPADWVNSPIQSEWQGDHSRFRSGNEDFLTIRIHDLPKNGLGDWTLDDYVDFWMSWIESDEGQGKVIRNAEYGYIGGKPARLLSYTQGLFHGAQLLFVSEQKIAYSVEYDMRAPPADEAVRMVEYSFGTLTVGGRRLTRLTDVPEFPSLDTVSSGDTHSSPESSQVLSRFGPMATYSDDEFAFSIQYPADWENMSEEGEEVLTFTKGDRDAFRARLDISIIRLPEAVSSGWSFDRWIDDAVANLETHSSVRVISSSPYGDIDGQPARLLLFAYTDNNNTVFTVQLVYVSAEGASYLITLGSPASQFDDFVSVFEYILHSTRIDGNPLTDAPEFPSLDSVSSGDTQSPPESSQQQNAFGPLATYRDDQFAFSIEYPAGWQAVSPGSGWTAVFESDRGEALRIAIDRDWDGLNQWNAYREAASLIEYYKSRDDRVQALSHLRYGYIDGLPARLLVVGTDTRLSAVLVYISEDGARYTVGYFLSAPWFDELAPLFEYSFHSIIIDGKPLIGAPKFPSLDSASSDDAQPSPESSQMQSPFGPMSTYRDDKFGFVMQYPAYWEHQVDSPAYAAHFDREGRRKLNILFQDLSALGFTTADQYIDQILSKSSPVIDEYRVLSNSDFGEIDGRPAKLLVYASNDDSVRLVQFVYVSGEGVAYTATLDSLTPMFDELAPMFNHLFRSITINGKPLINTPEFPRVE